MGDCRLQHLIDLFHDELWVGLQVFLDVFQDDKCSRLEVKLDVFLLDAETPSFNAPFFCFFVDICIIDHFEQSRRRQVALLIGLDYVQQG